MIELKYFELVPDLSVGTDAANKVLSIFDSGDILFLSGVLAGSAIERDSVISFCVEEEVEKVDPSLFYKGVFPDDTIEGNRVVSYCVKTADKVWAVICINFRRGNKIEKQVIGKVENKFFAQTWILYVNRLYQKRVITFTQEENDGTEKE